MTKKKIKENKLKLQLEIKKHIVEDHTFTYITNKAAELSRIYFPNASPCFVGLVEELAGTMQNIYHVEECYLNDNPED